MLKNQKEEEKRKMNREHVEGILPERLENYIKELEEDMNLNEMNIHDKTLQRSALAAKWARYSYEEERFKKKILEQIETLKQTIAEKLYEKKKDAIVNQHNPDVLIKVEVEKLLKKSTQYAKIKDDLENQDDIIRFIAEAKVIMNSYSYDIKNAIEVLKLEN